MIDYTDNHDNGKLSFFDRDFNLMPFRRTDYQPIDKNIEPPKSFKRMIEIAERLSDGFPHVRVDFYDVNGEVVFGEMTFYNSCGYTQFEPDEFDYILGNEFLLPFKK